jgi:hypothetical protein
MRESIAYIIKSSKMIYFTPFLMPITSTETTHDCFPDALDTDPLPEPLSVFALGEDIRSITLSITDDILKLFPNESESGVRRLNETRVQTLRDTLLTELKVSDKARTLKTYGELREAGKAARIAITKATTASATLPSKQIHEKVTPLVKNGFAQMLAKVQKIVSGTKEPATSVPVKKFPLPVGRTQYSLQSETIHTQQEYTPALEKLSILMNTFSPELLRSVKVAGRPLVSGTEFVSGENSHLLGEFCLYISVVLEKINKLNNKTVSLQYGMHQEMIGLQETDREKYRILESWVKTLLPGIIAWNDLQPKTKRLSPAISVSADDSSDYFVDANALLMPQKSAHMNKREKNPDNLWELTSDEKGVLSAFYTKEKERTKEWKKSDNATFLVKATEIVNSECNGSMALLRSDKEVVAYIQIYEAIHAPKTEEVLQSADTPVITDQVLQNTEEVSVETSLEVTTSSLVTAEQDVAVSEPTKRKVRGKSQKIRALDVNNTPLRDLAKHALATMEDFADMGLGHGDQLLISLLKQWYQHLQARTQDNNNAASFGTAFDTFAV